MSKRIQVIVCIIAVMIASTGYWLYRIDTQEQVVTNFYVQEDNWQDKKYHSKKLDLDVEIEKAIGRETMRKENNEITSAQKTQAEQKIKASYRYMIVIDIVLAIALIPACKIRK